MVWVFVQVTEVATVGLFPIGYASLHVANFSKTGFLARKDSESNNRLLVAFIRQEPSPVSLSGRISKIVKSRTAPWERWRPRRLPGFKEPTRTSAFPGGAAIRLFHFAILEEY